MIEILEPSSVDIVTLQRDGDLICVWCDCDNGVPCPQGKVGSQTRCRVWLKSAHISKKGIEHEKRMNRVDR